MAKVKNEISTEVSILTLKSVFHGSKVEMDDNAREIITSLNTVATDITSSQFKVRDFTYAYVAKLADAAHEYTAKSDVAGQFNALYKSLRLPEPEKGDDDRNVNPYLNLVRAADGEWVSGTNGRGEPFTAWKHNRSGEKYASACRFAVTNGFTGDELLALLGGKEEIEITYMGQDHKIKPTLNAIIAFDRLQFPTGEREIISNNEWIEINHLRPLFEVPFTEKMKSAFTTSEGAMTEGALIEGLLVVRDGNLMVVGSSGRIGNVVQRVFKARYHELNRAYDFAMRKSDDLAELPAGVSING